jgi:hypothetical protein
MGRSLVLVLRCSERPVSWVPSIVVACATCGADCWLSASTGAGTIAAARALGTAEFVCDSCEKQLKTWWIATEEALREARSAGN